MKIPFTTNCLNGNCGKEITAFIDIEDDSVPNICPHCSFDNSGTIGTDVTIGPKLRAKSMYEFKTNEDYSMTIVFAAMAFECELFRLFLKWSRIGFYNEINNVELEDTLRNMGILDKINVVSKLLTEKKLDEFVVDSADLKGIIEKGFPSLELGQVDKGIVENVFWPRNRILHLGKGDYSKDAAIKCFNISNLGLRILKDMDKFKRISR